MPEIALILVLVAIAIPLKLLKFLFTLPERRQFEEAALAFANALRAGAKPPAEAIHVLGGRPYQFRDGFSDFYPGSFLKDRYGWFATSQDLVRDWREEHRDQTARERARRKHEGVIDEFTALKKDCGDKWTQVVRTASVLRGGGKRAPDIQSAMHVDILELISGFSTAGGGCTDDLGRLYQAFATLWGDHGSDFYKYKLEVSDYERQGIVLPSTIEVLACADGLFGTKTAFRAGQCFRRLVDETALCCKQSLAVAAAKQRYEVLLAPYSTPGTREVPGGAAPAESGRSCATCKEAYELLELPPGADADAIASARRELVKSLHPDAWGQKRGSRFAEEQLKRINAAYDHLTTCQSSPYPTLKPPSTARSVVRKVI
jgi:hypothetical protein